MWFEYFPKITQIVHEKQADNSVHELETMKNIVAFTDV